LSVSQRARREVIEMAVAHDFYVDKGTDYAILVGLVDDDEKPQDLLGFKARMQVRENFHSEWAADELTTENGRLVCDSDGLHVSFPGAVTSRMPPKTYKYDIELIAPNGCVTRILEGRVFIRSEVTR